MADVNVLLNRAKSALIAHDYVLAAKLYKTLIEENPESLDYRIQLGNLYVKAGKDQQALAVFKEVEKKDGSNCEVLMAMSGIYRRLKKYDESIAVLEKALVFCADSPEQKSSISYNLGFTYRQMGNYDEAIPCFEEVIEQNPDDVLAYNHLGAVYALKGNHEKAIENYLGGLKFDKNHPVLQFNIARSFAAIGETQKALGYYEGALRSKPGWLEAIEEYANLLLETNNVREADDVVTQALKINPDDVKMHTAKGNVYNRQSVFENAEIEFKKALDGDDTYTPALTGLAHSQERQGKTDDATETIRRASELEPDDPSILKQSAHILLSANELSAAYEKIARLWSKDNKDAQTINLLGQYYICKGDTAKAESCRTRIQNICPGYDDFYRDWGMRFMQKDDEQNAETYLQNAVQKNPGDAEALVFLGELYEGQGRTNLAVDMYRNASNTDIHNCLSKKRADRLVAGGLAARASAERAAFSVPRASELIDEKIDGDTLLQEENLLEDDILDAASDAASEAGTHSVAQDDGVFPETAELSAPEDSSGLSIDDDFDFSQFGAEQPSDGQNEAAVSVDDLMRIDEEAERQDEPADFDELIDDGAPVDDGDAADYTIVPDGSELIDENPAETVVVESDKRSTADIPRYDDSFEEKQAELSAAALETMREQMEKLSDIAAKADYAARQAWIAAEKAADSAQAASVAVEKPDSSENDVPEPEEPEAANEENEFMNEDEEPELDTEESDFSTDISDDGQDKGNKPMDDFDTDSLMMRRAIDMLPDIVAAIEDRHTLRTFRTSLEMFKKLREMLEYLPAEQKEQFLTSKNRILLDYVIAKLSGQPGLFATAKALIRSGIIHENDSLRASEKNGVELAKEVVSYLRTLGAHLEDATLRTALDNEAQNLLAVL